MDRSVTGSRWKVPSWREANDERCARLSIIARDNQTAISRLINLDLPAALVGQGHHNVAKYVHELGMPGIRYQLAHVVEPLVRVVREAIRLSRR